MMKKMLKFLNSQIKKPEFEKNDDYCEEGHKLVMAYFKNLEVED